MDRKHLKTLKQAWKNGNLLPFIGAGVSIGAAGLPTWPELYSRGISFVEKNQFVHGNELDELKRLEKDNQIKLPEKFEKLKEYMLRGNDDIIYDEFLIEQFRVETPPNTDTLTALKKLNSRIILTTNYDKLIEDFCFQDDTHETWQDTKAVFHLLRNGRGTIHFHGRYDQSESVILTQSDYKRIVNEDDVRQFARAIFFSGILLFIGCSLDGVSDDHLGTILGEFTEQLGHDLFKKTSPHIILVNKGDMSASNIARFRRLGILPVEYGNNYADLPDYLNKITSDAVPLIDIAEVRNRLFKLRTADTLGEILEDAKMFIQQVVFPGRKVRVAFAEKQTEGANTVLKNVAPLPPLATHNVFGYPHTLAAWALIEGRIFSFPTDLEHFCDFDHLKKLKKEKEILTMIDKLDPEEDVIGADFLDFDLIKNNAKARQLKLEDIYQHWVGRQPKKHYDHFISVPVPIIETITRNQRPPEYCVINIDTKDETGDDPEPLLNDRTGPLLKLISDVIAAGYSKFRESTEETEDE